MNTPIPISNTKDFARNVLPKGIWIDFISSVINVPCSMAYQDKTLGVPISELSTVDKVYKIDNSKVVDLTGDVIPGADPKNLQPGQSGYFDFIYQQLQGGTNPKVFDSGITNAINKTP